MKVGLSDILVNLFPGFVRIWIWRIQGHQIGNGVKISWLSLVLAKKMVLQDHARIHPFTFIKVRSLAMGKRTKIKSLSVIDTVDFELGDDSVIMEQVLVGGMMTCRSRLKIGKRVKVFPFSFLNPTEPIEIGDDVGIGGSNYIFTHGSWQNMLDGFPVSFGPVKIEKGVWFPWRVFVMPNVTVGEYSTIGASSVITRDIPPRSLAVGTPARVVKSGDEYIRPLSKSAKHQRIIEILQEFDEHVRFLGWQVAMVKSEDGLRLQGRDGTKRRFNYVYQKVGRFDSSLEDDVQICLESSADVGDWHSRFSIEEKILTTKDFRRVEELRNFFSRFGIRFEIVAK